MTKRSIWYGYEIEMVGEEWVFTDTGQFTVNSNRPCGYCHKYKTIEGHDACLGTLPGVKNACCGHGKITDAYVQKLNDEIIQGYDAITWILDRDKNKGRIK